MLIQSSFLIWAMIQVFITGSQSMIQPSASQDACVDTGLYCDRYASQCHTNAYVQGKCRKTCNLCKNDNRIDACVDTGLYCGRYASECHTNSYVQGKCRKTCNLCNNIRRIDACVDTSPNCANNANQCHTNSYVQDRCKKTCNLCEIFIESGSENIIHHAPIPNAQRRMASSNINDELSMNDMNFDHDSQLNHELGSLIDFDFRAEPSDTCVDISPYCFNNADQCHTSSYVQERCKKTCKQCRNSIASGEFKTTHITTPKTVASSPLPLFALEPSSPQMFRLDKMFEMIGLVSGDCRKQLVCHIYKDPALYVSYLDKFAMEFALDLEELQKPNVSGDHLQLYRDYTKAAHMGQNEDDCRSLYPSCSINTTAKLMAYRNFSGQIKTRDNLGGTTPFPRLKYVRYSFGR